MAEQNEQLIDELLVMECQDGSAKALEALVARWQKRLWRYAYRVCRPGDQDTPQRVFARHRLKGGKEQAFSEVLSGLDLHHPPCQELIANRHLATALQTSLQFSWVLQDVRNLQRKTSNMTIGVQFTVPLNFLGM